MVPAPGEARVCVKGVFAMRKTVVLLLSAAFVAALPSIASAKQKRVRHAAPPPAASQSTGGKFVSDALYQLIVPWQQTFAPRPVVEKRVRVRHAAKRRPKTS